MPSTNINSKWVTGLWKRSESVKIFNEILALRHKPGQYLCKWICPLRPKKKSHLTKPKHVGPRWTSKLSLNVGNQGQTQDILWNGTQDLQVIWWIQTCKQLLYIHRIKINKQPNPNIDRRSKYTFWSKEERQMPKRPVKRCPKSIIIRGMQFQNNISPHNCHNG